MHEFEILLVDDSPNILKGLQRTLKSEGYKLHLAGSAAEAMIILNEHDIDLIIADENMPETSGTELLAAVRKLYPAVVRMMLTGTTDIEVAKSAINKGEIYRLFSKPWDDFELLITIRNALIEKRTSGENMRLKSLVEKQEQLLNALEKEHPGITKKRLGQDGAIIIDE